MLSEKQAAMRGNAEALEMIAPGTLPAVLSLLAELPACGRRLPVARS